jgi:hypothetical protein
MFDYWREANLQDADFHNSNLSEANFSASNLKNANFQNANCEKGFFVFHFPHPTIYDFLSSDIFVFCVYELNLD